MADEETTGRETNPARLMTVAPCAHERMHTLNSGFENYIGLCAQCGAVATDYSERPTSARVWRESPLLQPFLAVCQELLDAQGELRKRARER